jgi:hypothetical protein
MLNRSDLSNIKVAYSVNTSTGAYTALKGTNAYL